jgi:hypothetical protein
LRTNAFLALTFSFQCAFADMSDSPPRFKRFPQDDQENTSPTPKSSDTSDSSRSGQAIIVSVAVIIILIILIMAWFAWRSQKSSNLTPSQITRQNRRGNQSRDRRDRGPHAMLREDMHVGLMRGELPRGELARVGSIIDSAPIRKNRNTKTPEMRNRSRSPAKRTEGGNAVAGPSTSPRRQSPIKRGIEDVLLN